MAMSHHRALTGLHPLAWAPTPVIDRRPQLPWRLCQPTKPGLPTRFL